MANWRRGLITIRGGTDLAGGGHDHPAANQRSKVAERFLSPLSWWRERSPKVVPYTFDDVVRTLNQVTPYDWDALLKPSERSEGRRALGGIERGGWRLVYNDKPIRLFTREKDNPNPSMPRTPSVS